ncbi:MAG: adenylate kinase [Candidatus Aenigmarchaeota archaeon]|nr:adenylate kinase [Candidatus Aenigmarchaeota archaeon]
MHLIILGPHGAGKGTQAKLVAQHYKIAHISTGDILREHIKNKTNVGIKAKEYIAASKYVPDKIVDVVVVLKLRNNKEGFVLDGYPRTLVQAEFLNNVLRELGIELDAAINLQVDKEELIKRMIKRGQKEKRTDDTEEGIRSRMNEYETKAEPVIKYYRGMGKVIDINGDQSIEKVFKDIKEILDKLER